MDARTAHASVANQQTAARWFGKFQAWRDEIGNALSQPARSSCAVFAIQTQEDASRLYAADRRLRGLEA